VKKFEIVSGKMIVTDPCYTIPTWCQVILNNVKNGIWIASVDVKDCGNWGDRVHSLRAIHIDTFNIHKNNLDNLFHSSSEINGTLGVDSGQLGFFDLDNYRKDEMVKDLPKTDYDISEGGDSWYNAICKITLSDEQWGVIDNGVATSSGYGDGSYRANIVEENNEIVAIEVIFIDENED